MSFAVTPVTLEGTHVRLEPLTPAHAPALFEIGTDDEIWEYLPIAPFRRPEDATAWVDWSLRQSDQLPFAVIDRTSGKVAGSTRYLEIRPADRGLEIGFTWYGLAYQRTAVNSEAKLLLLTHAFEQLGAIRVQFKTDGRNERSQRAIERIGAQREGVLRKHRILPKDGYVRDSVYFSIVDDEWPAIKRHLGALLNAIAPSS